MDDENRFILIEYEDDLEKTSTPSLAPDQPLVVFDFSRVRPDGMADNGLGFLG